MSESIPAEEELKEDKDNGSGGSDESSEYETDDETDDEEEDGVVGTFPYGELSGEEEEDENDPCYQWLKSNNAGRPTTEVITIDDDDDDEIIGEMRCYRCPDSQSIYKDRTLFILHRERHKARNHFVCPACLKPFIKISFCFAHEIRNHGMEFPLQNPLIGEAVEYRDMKRELDKESQILEKPKPKTLAPIPFSGEKRQEFTDVDFAEFSMDQQQTNPSEIIKTSYCTNFAGLVLFPEEHEYETDDDDPKFFHEHTVPSTALYPYRGLEPMSVYDCYEIHLKYGRKKRTSANTISRCVLAHTTKLLKEKKMSTDNIGRFWKPDIPIPKAPKPPSSVSTNSSRSSRASKRKRGTDSSSVASSSRKKRKAQSHDEIAGDENVPKKGPRRKKRKLTAPKGKPMDITNRAFVAGVICRTCQLCCFTWSSELHLKEHRDRCHPNKTLVELMTVLKEPCGKKSSEGKYVYYDIDDLPHLPKPKKRKTERINYKDTEQDRFLANLELVSVRKLALINRKRKIPIRGKVCFVKLTALRKPIPRSGRVFLCPEKKCSYYDNTRDLITMHRRMFHEWNKQYWKPIIINNEQRTSLTPQIAAQVPSTSTSSTTLNLQGLSQHRIPKIVNPPNETPKFVHPMTPLKPSTSTLSNTKDLSTSHSNTKPKATSRKTTVPRTSSLSMAARVPSSSISSNAQGISPLNRIPKKATSRKTTVPRPRTSSHLMAARVPSISNSQGLDISRLNRIPKIPIPSTRPTAVLPNTITKTTDPRNGQKRSSSLPKTALAPSSSPQGPSHFDRIYNVAYRSQETDKT